MDRAHLLGLVTELGKAFSRRGMSQHVRLLRIYYWALERGLTSPSHELNVKWSEPFVVDWLKTLRVPPYQQTYPVRPRGAGCQRCAKGAQSGTNVELVFPGGARVRCQGCEEVWIEDDQAEAAVATAGPTWRDRRTKR